MTVFLEKKINMLKKITKRKLFLREFVRKSQWQGIYVGFEVRIVLTISSLSFFFFQSFVNSLLSFYPWVDRQCDDGWIPSRWEFEVADCSRMSYSGLIEIEKNNFSRTLLLSAENWAFWERSSIRVNSETSVLRFRINRKRSFYNEPPCLRKATLIPCS